MDLHVSVNAAMVIAVVVGEFVSALWYSNSHRFGGNLGDRYLITALICDAGLVIFIKHVIEHYWSVSQWEQALMLSLWLTLFFASLQAPHHVHDTYSFSNCLVHIAHKFTLIFVMIMCLVYFRHL